MIRRLASLLKKTTDPKNDYVKLSYSQCGEDLIVDFLFSELSIEKPSYIDIGAHHPRFINNTFLLYQKGSRGINIEPDTTLFREFILHRKEDTNLNIGIGEQAGVADFYIMNVSSLNTFVKSEAENIVSENSSYKISEVKKIEVRPIADILKEFNNGNFPDFLTIDVEGLDEQILRGINFEASKPKIMCVETLTFSENGRGVKKTALVEYLKGKGYLAYADTNINTIFIQEKLWLR